jgi:hypothetical protein
MTVVRRHLDWSLAIGAVALGIVGYLLGDRTNWTSGYGYDGRFYGELATNFPSAVLGHGAIVPPGIGVYDGPHLSGVDSYYAFRIVPSGIVWVGLHVLGLSGTHAHVVLLFALLAALMFGVATFCWCRSADLLGLGEQAKLVGAIGLIVNFAVLRTGTYYPVLTDHVALAVGALSLYLWLRRATLPLVVCIVVGCFAWPITVVIGALLLLFPPPEDAREQLAAAARSPAPARWRPAPFGLAVGGLAAVVGMFALTWLQVRGYRSREGTDQLPLFPLSVAIVGLYVFAVVAFLLPPGGLRQLLGIVRALDVRRVVLVGGLVVGVLVAASLLARRPGYQGVVLFKDAFWSTTLDPGIFLVVLVCYYGPLLLLVVGDLPRVAADAWRLGPAMVGIIGLGLMLALVNQPREIIESFPFVLLAAVLAARRLYVLSRPVVLAFLALSVLLARPWLHIGSIGLDLTKLQDFPAQRYYMATGTWTSPLTYGLQLAAVAITGAALWLATRPYRRHAPRATPQPAVPVQAPGTSAG